MTTARSFNDCLQESRAKKRTTKLTNLTLDELSLVDNGANKGARVSVFKRDESADDSVAIRKGAGAVGDPEAELERLAKTHAEKHSVSFAKAYDEVLQTPEGRALYTQTDAQRDAKPIAKSAPEPVAIEKSAEEIELDEFVKGYAAKHDVSFHKAYLPAIGTDRGREIFRKVMESPANPIAKRNGEVGRAVEASSNAMHDVYDKLAKSIQRPGETYHQAYERALRERPEIYRGDCQVRRVTGV